MGLLIAVAIAVLVLIVFDALALRYGADTRPGPMDERPRDMAPKFL